MNYTQKLGNEAYVRSSAVNPGDWGEVALDAIGANWRHTYQRAIVLISNNSMTTAFAYRHDGRVVPFNLHNGSFVPATPAINDRLTQLGNGTWEYVSADESGEETETYSASGRLLQIANRSGMSHSLSYDNKGRLAQVADSFGHTLTFAYADPDTSSAAINQIIGFSDPAGGQYSFAYSASSLLVDVAYPDGTSRQCKR